MWACVPWISRYDRGDVINSEGICNMVQRPFPIISASVSLFVDLYVIAIPINRVARLNMPRRKKGKCLI
ncbi:hypothetical protein EX30DRAFT_211046 [Ascodesmis nigricans]|uniref:Uncharacterized protein n=1 Tax=Ascodesmis nigricans TaxID=341454 RepID=A0A4S2MQZ4_9PEZI|nr:hypothetical protein EX30DRAFT_211046 [Ascodesmis nigricans]